MPKLLPIVMQRVVGAQFAERLETWHKTHHLHPLTWLIAPPQKKGKIYDEGETGFKPDRSTEFKTEHLSHHDPGALQDHGDVLHYLRGDLYPEAKRI